METAVVLTMERYVISISSQGTGVHHTIGKTKYD